MGEYGIGVLANSLEMGCDRLGEIYYFDACANDNDGHPQPIPNAICLLRGGSRHLVEARGLAHRQDRRSGARGGW
jgi:Cu2+-containing amine oxidase